MGGDEEPFPSESSFPIFPFLLLLMLFICIVGLLLLREMGDQDQPFSLRLLYQMVALPMLVEGFIFILIVNFWNVFFLLLSGDNNGGFLNWVSIVQIITVTSMITIAVFIGFENWGYIMYTTWFISKDMIIVSRNDGGVDNRRSRSTLSFKTNLSNGRICNVSGGGVIFIVNVYLSFSSSFG